MNTVAPNIIRKGRYKGYDNQRSISMDMEKHKLNARYNDVRFRMFGVLRKAWDFKRN